jgi:magnesium chelatase family protein
MTPRLIRRHCALGDDENAFLRRAIDRVGLSTRASDRAIRVARTIADLEDSGEITRAHLAEAIQYRTLDRCGRMME